jgi:glycoside/pentoside/hexuronide:cation symporter, GPH family
MNQSATVPPLANTDNPPPLALSICIGWGMGFLGLMTLLQAVNTLVLKYATDIIGISAALAGFVIAATRIFDAITDPIMGAISDKTSSKIGRRRPYLLIGAIGCAVCPILLYVLPQIVPDNLGFAYFTAVLLIYSLAYTIFNVPHLAMPVEMTQDPKERTYLFTYRMYGFAIGNLIGGTLAPYIVGHYGGSQHGYAMMGWVVSAVVLLSCLISFHWTAKAPVAHVTKEERSLSLAQFGQAIRNQPLRMLLLIKVFLVTGAGVAGGALAFFIATVMEKPLTIFPWFGLPLMAGILLSQPVWLSMANRFGKRRTYLLAGSLYVLVLLSWHLSGPNETLAVFGLRAFFLGACAGGALLASQSMLPDVLHYEVETNGNRNEGTLSGMFSTAERASSALGVAIAGMILSAGGYISGSVDAVQPPSAVTAIYICVGLAPALGVTLSMIAAWRYSLKG